MKVAIYRRGLADRHQVRLLALINELHKYKVSIAVSASLAERYWDSMSAIQDISVFTDKTSLDETTDCLISLGGDGTILDAVTLIGDKNIPILGINFGRLGFLASIGKEELSIAVDALVNGTYVADKRIIIHIDSDVSLFKDAPFALNEFGIHKRDTSPMIKIHTYLNGEFLNSYWADGLVVSTPTGSTGYSMSCNGPIVFPGSSSFCITPVAPHNLNIRPIIVPDSNIVSFEIEGRSEQFICTLDARKEIVEKDIQLAVKKEEFPVLLVVLNENSFLSTLREKLTWGFDKRNK